jgi:hypothetical protein
LIDGEGSGVKPSALSLGDGSFRGPLCFANHLFLAVSAAKRQWEEVIEGDSEGMLAFLGVLGGGLTLLSLV